MEWDPIFIIILLVDRYIVWVLYFVIDSSCFTCKWRVILIITIKLWVKINDTNICKIPTSDSWLELLLTANIRIKDFPTVMGK